MKNKKLDHTPLLHDVKLRKPFPLQVRSELADIHLAAAALHLAYLASKPPLDSEGSNALVHILTTHLWHSTEILY